MRQLFQDLRSGEVFLRDIPTPSVGPHEVLVRTVCSLVSPGTERMLLEFGKGGWITKARQQPDKVRAVLTKLRTDGIQATVHTVLARLNEPLPLGYSNVGVVLEIGSSVTGVRPGMRVLSNGGHGEQVVIPKHLCVPIPEEVSDDEAVFGVLGAISLQGVRLLRPEIGESVVVLGLGVIGLLAVQQLLAAGCRVIAADPDPTRVALATAFGAEGVVLEGTAVDQGAVTSFLPDAGADAVLICAAARSNAPIELAPKLCRTRGRIVLVGVVGLNLNRRDFYDKEISFQVSCSYGPGRYDHLYEDQGLDYPIGYVRWTEERNLAAVLELMRRGSLRCRDLVSDTVDFASAALSYESLLTKRGSLGILFRFNEETSICRNTPLSARPSPVGVRREGDQTLRVGFIGAGKHVRHVLARAFAAQRSSVVLRGVCSSGGRSASHLAHDLGFEFAASGVDEIINDSRIDAVVVAVGPGHNAEISARCLAAGKHVYVEKPAAVSLQEMMMLRSALQDAQNRVLTVGFNRRYSPLTQDVVAALKGRRSPITILITVNGGPVASGTEESIASGRLIGEACHFVDLAHAIVGADVEAVAVEPGIEVSGLSVNEGTILLRFRDGSTATILYTCRGSKSFPKENVLIFSEGRVLRIDNMRTIRGFGSPLRSGGFWSKQRKGHHECVSAFCQAALNDSSQLSSDAALHSSMASVAVAESFRLGRQVTLQELETRPATGAPSVTRVANFVQ
jgi:predicted dehydrogenase/threonine dehydrogenase-like Zn-dependent dehydrogenase